MAVRSENRQQCHGVSEAVTTATDNSTQSAAPLSLSLSPSLAPAVTQGGGDKGRQAEEGSSGAKGVACGPVVDGVSELRVWWSREAAV